MMETWILVLAIIMLFFAGMMQGLAGFGFSMVSIPILIMCIDSQLLIPIVIVHSLIINAFLFYKVRKCAELKRISPLIATAIIGIPIGTYLLLVIDPQAFKVFIGIFIVLFGIAYLMDFRKELKNEKLTFIPVGLISGILNGSITLSGPPVIFCFTNQGVKKRIFRANRRTLKAADEIYPGQKLVIPSLSSSVIAFTVILASPCFLTLMGQSNRCSPCGFTVARACKWMLS